MQTKKKATKKATKTKDEVVVENLTLTEEVVEKALLLAKAQDIIDAQRSEIAKLKKKIKNLRRR